MSAQYFLNEAQLEILASPIRLAIVQRLEIDKSATAAELAAQLGRRVTSLYHHLKRLEEAGLLRTLETRPTMRRPEAVYALVANFLSSRQAVRSTEGRRAYGRTALRVAEAGARALSATLEEGQPRFEGDQRNAMVQYYVLRASAEKLARLNALLNELGEEAKRSCHEGDEIQLTVLLSGMRLRT